MACYQDYLRGAARPDRQPGRRARSCRRRRWCAIDGDDPYLVVAADKGTATFSDYANAISAEYGHWLGDAFASGGSAGYDHKEMGITARGAWESVKRHFREMGVDTQATDFTRASASATCRATCSATACCCRAHIRLVAAFDHRHIFIDPNPDAAASLRRARAPVRAAALVLGRLRREADFAPAAASGPASEKSIPVSPQAQAVLGIAAATLTPTELISAILQGAGGPALQRRHRHLRQGRSRDATPTSATAPTMRSASTARELRCKVVGEGGNLGLHPARTHRGGAQRRDASTPTRSTTRPASTRSDHEVNIKILLGLPMADGELTREAAQRAAGRDDRRRRPRWCCATTTSRPRRCRSAGTRRASCSTSRQRFMRFLEKEGRLNRAIEFLPSDDEIAERRARRASA